MSGVCYEVAGTIMTIAFFGPSNWCIGDTYRTLASRISNAVHFDWAVSHPSDTFARFDRVLTQAGEGTICLSRNYHVSQNKILVVGHAASDLIAWLKSDGIREMVRYAGYGVVSETLAAESLAMGITRIPVVLPQGIDCGLYDCPLPETLKTVGYAAVWRRPNEFGVEIKRGELAQRAAEVVDLQFRSAAQLPKQGEPYYQSKITPPGEMPAFYRSVDAVIMPSLQEGGGMPMLEGAAAGRLCIGTPVGDFPRLAYEGMGILAPLDAEAFVRFTAGRLQAFKEDVPLFQEQCKFIKQNAQKRDWKNVIGDWERFIGV